MAADTELTNDLEVKQTYFKASRYLPQIQPDLTFRCILIARSHTLLKDHVSALALYEKAQTYLTKIPSSVGTFPEKDIPVTQSDVTTLTAFLQGEMTRSHAHVILSQPSPNESTYFQTVRPPPLSRVLTG